MKLRGNYKLFYFTEFFTGILLIFLFSFFGNIGLVGISIFFLALILTQKKNPDEREIFLMYKINTYDGIIVFIAITVIYFHFPSINWFYALIDVSLISRGVIGYLMFSFN